MKSNRCRSFGGGNSGELREKAEFIKRGYRTRRGLDETASGNHAQRLRLSLPLRKRTALTVILFLSLRFNHHEQHQYPGANHGFHNDTTPRYDEAAAKLAWSRTLEFFARHLRGA